MHTDLILSVIFTKMSDNCNRRVNARTEKDMIVDVVNTDYH